MLTSHNSHSSVENGNVICRHEVDAQGSSEAGKETIFMTYPLERTKLYIY